MSRGLKGGLFGHQVKSTCSNVIEYRSQGAKHTLQLHRLGTNDLYGLEIGRWTFVLGDTTPIVIPRKELLQLRDAIDEFVSSEEES